MLDLMMTLVVPLTLGLVAVYAACRRVEDVYKRQALSIGFMTERQEAAAEFRGGLFG